MINKILNSEDYLKEKTLFSLIPFILSSETLEYFTDGKNYLICRSNPDTPIWVWNKDNINEDIINEILLKLDSMLDKDKVIQITSKQVIFNRLINKYKEIVVDNYFIQKGNYVQMKAYECKNLIKPKKIIGQKERPTYDDIELLTDFKKCDLEDVLRAEYAKQVTKDQLLETAKKYIDDPNFYVWKVNNRIVATAGYIDNRVSKVFTNRMDRGNGYAGMLCYELCKEIIQKGKTPMLYADADYISSNRAYKKIGFEEVGNLYNVKIGKAKLKKLER